MNPRPLRVLVVDDSALVREMTRAILSRERFEVEVAADPLIAMRKMAQTRPDVMLLDLEMPRMDGLTFLRQVMADDPLPVVVCSSVARPGTIAALRALEEGALSIVQKPQLGVRDFLEESATALVDAVTEASHARVFKRAGRSVPAPTPPPMVLGSSSWLAPSLAARTVIALGASTGGPQALQAVLTALPEDAPGIAVVQHMPEAFTGAFARRLDEACALEVKEAAHGDRLFPGRALIAPGNRHLRIQRDLQGFYAELSAEQPVSRHRPSVDVLFESVARSAGADGIGVLMTGMGEDGARGLLDMKKAGAFTLAQDEASSVVFGMPGQAIARGAVVEVAPLSRIPNVIVERLRLEGRGLGHPTVAT
ncbi:MAG: chemotaxis response regulator protein-glutamate methylesterase [Deltaproteobacteria bacterium]|nr:chemotaxis response regulator protein-glutamate methylesterase [Deltaproteobacteria bacterium]